jgi:D-aminopeptidase
LSSPHSATSSCRTYLLYLAAVEAVEEAVVNAMVAADSMTTVRPSGKLCRAIDHNRLCEIMRKYGRL